MSFSCDVISQNRRQAKTAAVKAHIKCWVNRWHDVVTAEDMKGAIESHGGIKGCRAAVIGGIHHQGQKQREQDTRHKCVEQLPVQGVWHLSMGSMQHWPWAPHSLQ